MTTSVVTGLSDAEVAQRVAEGKTNDVPTRAARSVSDIVRGNVFTRINAILGVLLIIVLSTGSVINGAFGLLIIANSAIGIIQELRAKRTLDQLAIVGQAKPLVRRQSGTAPLPPDEVVLDDVIELGPGDQIVVDGVVLEDANLEVDESLLTGEADPIAKVAGDHVMSGSFVVAGSGAYRATKVGREAYAAKLAEEASKFTLVKSELRNGINKILQFITYLLVPAGALIIYTQLFTTGSGWQESVLRMVGALVPMVPEGLVLMTSIAFAVGVIRLGRRQCLVNELPAIEGLARVDVVCADKTGTLTENGMRFGELEPVDDTTADRLREVVAQVAAADPRPNASIQALAQEMPLSGDEWTVTAQAPFTSAKKWSGVSFEGQGDWVIGAPDVLAGDSEVASRAEQIGSTGRRVLLLGRSDRLVDDEAAPGTVTPVALLVLEQKVRPEARDTLQYFADQDVTVKVISGDNAVSVGAVTRSLGVAADSVMDARTLPSDPDAFADDVERMNVFGRVTPQQKREMVSALQARGHTVAMTGDGVNDVLAIKDSDLGVAMGTGAAATRSVAQLVLLDDSFATLPHVVAEGRRVIGNIERVANFFLTKTLYSVLLALLVVIWRLPFPFVPIHISLVGWFTIGIPASILALAPNAERARPGFLGRVMRFGIPASIAIGATTFACYLVTLGQSGSAGLTLQVSTATLIALLCGGAWVMITISRPYEWWKVLMIVFCVAATVAIFVVPLQFTVPVVDFAFNLQQVFYIDTGNAAMVQTGFLFGGIAVVLVEVIWWVTGKLTGGDRRRLFPAAG